MPNAVSYVYREGGMLFTDMQLKDPKEATAHPVREKSSGFKTAF